MKSKGNGADGTVRRGPCCCLEAGRTEKGSTHVCKLRRTTICKLEALSQTSQTVSPATSWVYRANLYGSPKWT